MFTTRHPVYLLLPNPGNTGRVSGRIEMKTAYRTAILVGLALLVARTLAAEEWFDAYEHGLAALRQHDAARAVELLERAAKKRPEPGTNVITYGTNRLDHYQPYLKLAEAYLLAGKPEAAQEALHRSEAQGKEPTADRERLAAEAQAALEKVRVAAAAPTAPSAAIVSTAAATAPPVGATLSATSVPTTAPTALRTAVAAASTLEPASERAARTRSSAPEHHAPAAAVAAATIASAAPAETTAAEATPLAPMDTAALVITTDPPGTTVYLDDEPLGESDPTTGRLVKRGVVLGRHRVRLAHAGFVAASEDVAIASGAPASLQRTLAPLAAPGTGAAVVTWLGVAALTVAGLGFVSWRWTRKRGPAPSASSPPPARTVTSVTLKESERHTVAGAPETQARAPGGATTTMPRAATSNAPAFKATTFGEYTLLAPLGKGGMAAVFKADRRGEVCALKRPLPALLEEPEFLERFLREAEIGRTLHHPNIIRILERGDVDGLPFFTMELVEGETLSALLKREGALEPRAGTRIVSQVAEALDYAHLKGVVHRDLKPSNIMVLPNGVVKVMDYGIARARRFEGLTMTGAFLGTPDYVAPETVDGQGADARSDLYSLGIVYYEILTGRRPFHGDTPFVTIKKHCTEPPTPPSSLNGAIPAQLEGIVLRLLRKDPAERFPGAEDLLIELRAFLNR
jgi:hypothetical protein